MNQQDLALRVGFDELLLVSLLVVAQAGISLWLQLWLEKRILISALRVVIQLSLVGFVLHWVLLSSSPWILAGVLGFMTLTGTHTISTRMERPYSGIWLDGFVSISGVTLSLDRVLNHFHDHRDGVETKLSHGATHWESIREPLKDSIRTGLLPILNSMSVAGLVSLPGALTGQLLAGQDPMLAARYQMVILILILCATFLGSLCAILLAFRRSFSPDHQLNRSVV